jgi:hypothetical protein
MLVVQDPLKVKAGGSPSGDDNRTDERLLHTKSQVAMPFPREKWSSLNEILGIK